MRDDPLIRALFDKLPPAGTDWPADERARWLATVAKAFDFLMPLDAEKKEPEPS